MRRQSHTSDRSRAGRRLAERHTTVMCAADDLPENEVLLAVTDSEIAHRAETR